MYKYARWHQDQRCLVEKMQDKNNLVSCTQSNFSYFYALQGDMDVRTQLLLVICLQNALHT